MGKPLFTQAYKWVPAYLMLKVTLRWTRILSREELEIFQVASSNRNWDIRPVLIGNLALMHCTHYLFVLILQRRFFITYCNLQKFALEIHVHIQVTMIILLKTCYSCSIQHTFLQLTFPLFLLHIWASSFHPKNKQHEIVKYSLQALLTCSTNK